MKRGQQPGEDLYLIAGVSAVVLLTLWLFHKELELTSYDPTHARVIGIRAALMRLLLLGLLALAVVTGIQAVGVILTNALLATPAAASALLTNKFPQRMAVAAVAAVGCAAGGLLASYLLQASSGASNVLACTAAFILAAAVQLGLVGGAALGAVLALLWPARATPRTNGGPHSRWQDRVRPRRHSPSSRRRFNLPRGGSSPSSRRGGRVRTRRGPS